MARGNRARPTARSTGSRKAVSADAGGTTTSVGAPTRRGFYDDAVSDLNAALKAVADNFGGRTALHLVPEYFPNRELSVRLLHQDNIGGQHKQLELSLGQHYTARAASTG